MRSFLDGVCSRETLGKTHMSSYLYSLSRKIVGHLGDAGKIDRMPRFTDKIRCHRIESLNFVMFAERKLDFLSCTRLPRGPSSRVKVSAVFTEYSGAFSGGTLKSKEAKAAAQEKGTEVTGPYLLVPGTCNGPDSEMDDDGMDEDFSWSCIEPESSANCSN